MKTEYRGFMTKVSKKGRDLVIIIPRAVQKYYAARDWVMVEPLVLIRNKNIEEDEI